MADGFHFLFVDAAPLEIPHRSERRIQFVLMTVTHREDCLLDSRAQRNLHLFGELLRVLPSECAERDGERVALR